jgi:decaprenyl-phosphate phosphoribosyltransferase
MSEAQVDVLPEEVPGAGPAAAIPATGSTAATARAILRSSRPRQWLKNVLVAAAPLAGGALTEASTLGRTALAFASFCLVASGTYLINDAQDVAADRRHPQKHRRPVAAGVLPVRLAVRAGAVLIAAGLVLTLVVNLALLGVVAAYVALTTAYSLWLKHEPVFDIATVAAGFFIRALAGGVASDIHVSRWFLIVTAFGSLYVVAGKRHAELVALGPGASAVRPSLRHYTVGYLRHLIAIAAGVTILGYCLWAFGTERPADSPWAELSVIPIVLGVMRYDLLLEHGQGGEPEEILLLDRPLQAFAVIWAALLAVGVYG